MELATSRTGVSVLVAVTTTSSRFMTFDEFRGDSCDDSCGDPSARARPGRTVTDKTSKKKVRIKVKIFFIFISFMPSMRGVII
jgi:hypothetical protein